MINKPNETYSDLEREYLLTKKINLEEIVTLVKKYPNDQDLGSEIRKLVNNKK